MVEVVVVSREKVLCAIVLLLSLDCLLSIDLPGRTCLVGRAVKLLTRVTL